MGGIKFLLQRKFFCISITEDDKMGITLISGKRRKINLGDISASTVKGRRYTLKDKNGKVIYKSDILENWEWRIMLFLQIIWRERDTDRISGRFR